MSKTDTLLIKLHDVFSFSESTTSLKENFCELAALAAKVLSAEDCTITLLSEAEIDPTGLRPGARFGDVPKVNSELAVTSGQIIAGSALSQSEDRVPTETSTDPGPKNKMFCSIVLNGRIIGVVHMNHPKHKRCFSREDLKLLDVLTLFIAKSIQTTQLQNILSSRFAQIALAQTTEKTIGDVIVESAQNPNQIARIVAKSFYREMTKAGFNRNQIIHAASEIISELSNSVRKHSKGHRGAVIHAEPAQPESQVRGAPVLVPAL
jgi:L-methionine (R)-S-oxide reductase